MGFTSKTFVSDFVFFYNLLMYSQNFIIISMKTQQIYDSFEIYYTLINNQQQSCTALKRFSKLKGRNLKWSHTF